MRDLIGRWTGIALALLLSLAVLWLGVTGDLVLYIHPRYEIFTMLMAALGLLGSIAGVVVLSRSERAVPDPTDTLHAHDDPPAPSRIAAIGLAATLAFAIVTMAWLPPATLSAATADQRDLSSGAVAVGGSALPAPDADAAQQLVAYAGSLRQGSTADQLIGQDAVLSGFVVASGGDEADPDTFQVARFVVTCCVVDARPVGVPVAFDDWQASLSPGDWVQLEGSFMLDGVAGAIVFTPSSVTPIDEPEDPYAY